MTTSSRRTAYCRLQVCRLFVPASLKWKPKPTSRVIPQFDDIISQAPATNLEVLIT